MSNWEPINGSFNREDWGRIRDALVSYVTNKESLLIESNSSDREWTELDRHKTITKDIECFLLGEDHNGLGYRHF